MGSASQVAEATVNPVAAVKTLTPVVSSVLKSGAGYANPVTALPTLVSKNIPSIGSNPTTVNNRTSSSFNTGGIAGQQLPSSSSSSGYSSGGYASGLPPYPAFMSGISQQNTLGSRPDIHANNQALETLRNESLVPSSESPWLKNQLQQIALQRQTELANAAKSAAGQTAQARSALAMRGGLSGGAAERLAMSGQRAGLLGQQDVRRTAQGLGLGAAQTAEENRLANLRALPSMEIAATQPEFANRAYQTGIEQYNIGNRLQDVAARNAYNMGQYSEAARAAAAQQMANAIAQGGGSGGTLQAILSGQGLGGLGGNNPLDTILRTNPVTAPISIATGGNTQLPFSLF